MKNMTETIDYEKLAAKFNLRGVAKRLPGRPRGRTDKYSISKMTLEERLERGCG